MKDKLRFKGAWRFGVSGVLAMVGTPLIQIGITRILTGDTDSPLKKDSWLVLVVLVVATVLMALVPLAAMFATKKPDRSLLWRVIRFILVLVGLIFACYGSLWIESLVAAWATPWLSAVGGFLVLLGMFISRSLLKQIWDLVVLAVREDKSAA